MRKLIGVLIMVLVLVGFYVSLQRRTPVNHEKKDIATTIEGIDKQITEQYPTDAKSVIEIYNEITHIIYSKQLKEGELEDLVKLQRRLYTLGFSELTPYEEQLGLTEKEIFLNKEKNLRLIKNEILGYSEKEDVTHVEVIYYSNKYDLTREYILLEEDSKWGIYGWIDGNPVESEQFEEQEEQEE